MDIEEIRAYCLEKPGVSECFPFDEVTLVFKVGGKMFALVSLDGDASINLKCDPEKAIELREHFSFVLPGYHMNKMHWNTVLMRSAVSNGQLKEWVDWSYGLVKNSLPKKIKAELE